MTYDVAAYTVHKFNKKYFGFELVDHSTSSPDLSTSDYYLFIQMEKHSKGMKHLSDSEISLLLKPI